MLKAKKVLITGLYRSGTTFIEKALDSKDKVQVLHQPFNLYFKHLDRLVWEQLKDTAWPELPMGYDAFWDLYNNKYLSDITFDQETINHIVEQSRNEAINHPGKNSVLFPKVEFYDLLVERLKPGNAHDIFEEIYNCIQLYRGEGSTHVGLKEIFLTPYLPLMADMEDLKIINVIRDPREIYFSRNYNSQKELFGTLERHPVKMIATIWNNHVLINSWLKNRYDNIINVFYDDIKDNSDAVVETLSQQLGVEEIAEQNFKDESGKEWTINTSDKSGKPGFGKKWQSEMSKEHIAMIEYICGDLMEMLGYKRYLSVEESTQLAHVYEEDLSTLKAWTKRDELIKL